MAIARIGRPHGNPRIPAKDPHHAACQGLHLRRCGGMEQRRLHGTGLIGIAGQGTRARRQQRGARESGLGQLRYRAPCAVTVHHPDRALRHDRANQGHQGVDRADFHRDETPQRGAGTDLQQPNGVADGVLDGRQRQAVGRIGRPHDGQHTGIGHAVIVAHLDGATPPLLPQLLEDGPSIAVAAAATTGQHGSAGRDGLEIFQPVCMNAHGAPSGDGRCSVALYHCAARLPRLTDIW